MRRSRGGALQPNEQKPKNGSRAPPSESIKMNFESNSKLLTVTQGHKRSNFGRNDRIRVKSGFQNILKIEDFRNYGQCLW